MRKITKYILTISTAILIKSCLPPSTDQIQKMETPDMTKTEEFGIVLYGRIIYQFYQKYGFTDIEEQLIMIVEPDNIDYLTKALPFDSTDIRKLEKIDLRKFVRSKPVNFAPEKIIQADIRLESKEYDSGEYLSIFYAEGKYRLIHTDTTETVFVFDRETGLMFFESKKMK